MQQAVNFKTIFTSWGVLSLPAAWMFLKPNPLTDMKTLTFNRLLLFSLFFLAHWFFGNLYEQIVLAPNQLTDSYQALKNWQGYFTISNQIYYYVPFTQMAVFVVCFLYFKSTKSREKTVLKKAGIYGLLSIAITFVIITQLNLKLFFGDLDRYKAQVYMLSVLWLIGNGVRLILVGNALYYTCKAYLLRQQLLSWTLARTE